MFHKHILFTIRIYSVRGRAIACFGLCLSSKDRVIIETVQEIMTPAVPGRPGHAPRLIKTPGAQNMFGKIFRSSTFIVLTGILVSINQPF